MRNGVSYHQVFPAYHAVCGIQREAKKKCYLTYKKNIYFVSSIDVEASRGAGAQRVPVNRLFLGSIPTRGNEIFISIYIFIFSLWCRGESAALNSATRHAMPPEIGGKWGTE